MQTLINTQIYLPIKMNENGHENGNEKGNEKGNVNARTFAIWKCKSTEMKLKMENEKIIVNAISNVNGEWECKWKWKKLKMQNSKMEINASRYKIENWKN